MVVTRAARIVCPLSHKAIAQIRLVVVTRAARIVYPLSHKAIAQARLVVVTQQLALSGQCHTKLSHRLDLRCDTQLDGSVF